MARPVLTKNRMVLALAIAVIADALQFPITGLTATGIFAIPGEMADFLVDCFVMAATVCLLGFHWLLLPSIFVELIPGLDLLPTWTGCVAMVIWLRRKELTARARPVIDVPTVKTMPEPPRLAPPISLPPPLPETAGVAAASLEARLARLNDLLEKKLITPAEFEAKRQRLLDDL